MDRHNGLARAGRAEHPEGAAVILRYDLPLRRMQEHRPPLPGEFEGALQLFDVVHDAETTLRVGVLEGVGGGNRRCRWRSTDG